MSNPRRKRILDNLPCLVLKLKEYYLIRDLDDGTNYSDIFNVLYVEKEDLTYDEIMYKFYISESNLKRFIKKANSLAKKLNDL